jgi:hypothetical protein
VGFVRFHFAARSYKTKYFYLLGMVIGIMVLFFCFARIRCL